MNIQEVIDYLSNLQHHLLSTLQTEDPLLVVEGDIQENERGVSRPQVCSKGKYIAKAAVQFTHSIGQRLPPAATERKPELAHKPFQAVAVSWIFHPHNPYVPTTHGNLRFFIAGEENPTWWFGGGFDLTPFYAFREDVVHWHSIAKKACDAFGQDIYPKFKQQCDEYFYLPHRKECRGVGGLFFEDRNTGNFIEDFALTKSIGDHFTEGYMPIFHKRKDMPYGEQELEHQKIRRGRYVEFNLLYDRGTKYGLQSGRRVEAVLASMPPIAHWEYEHTPIPNTPEADLVNFLQPQNWL